MSAGHWVRYLLLAPTPRPSTRSSCALTGWGRIFTVRPAVQSADGTFQSAFVL